MEEQVFQHMLSMYGINPTMIPLPLQFPKFPPGFMHPSFVTSVSPISAPKSNTDETINTKLQDFDPHNHFVKRHTLEQCLRALQHEEVLNT